MLISFFNPSDLVGCGGDINQSDSFMYAEGVCRGGMQRGYAEGVCGEPCGGGMQRGYAEEYVEGYTEGVHGRCMQRGYGEGYT